MGIRTVGTYYRVTILGLNTPPFIYYFNPCSLKTCPKLHVLTCFHDALDNHQRNQNCIDQEETCQLNNSSQVNRIIDKGKQPISRTYLGHIGNDRIRFDEGVYDTDYYSKVNMWKYDPMLYHAYHQLTMKAQDNTANINDKHNIYLGDKLAEMNIVSEQNETCVNKQTIKSTCVKSLYKKSGHLTQYKSSESELKDPTKILNHNLSSITTSTNESN